LAGSGCSVLIASRGVSSIPTVGEGSTQEEVRQLLGDPASSETRKDGTRIETFRVRRKVETLWESTFREQPPGFRGEMARYGQGALATLFLYGAPLGLPLAFDAVASGKALY